MEIGRTSAEYDVVPVRSKLVLRGGDVHTVEHDSAHRVLVDDEGERALRRHGEIAQRDRRSNRTKLLVGQSVAARIGQQRRQHGRPRMFERQRSTEVIAGGDHRPRRVRSETYGYAKPRFRVGRNSLTCVHAAQDGKACLARDHGLVIVTAFECPLSGVAGSDETESARRLPADLDGFGQRFASGVEIVATGEVLVEGPLRRAVRMQVRRHGRPSR